MNSFNLNNKAQVSMEYLIILAILSLMTVVVTVLVFNILKLKDVSKVKNSLYQSSLLEMI